MSLGWQLVRFDSCGEMPEPPRRSRTRRGVPVAPLSTYRSLKCHFADVSFVLSQGESRFTIYDILICSYNIFAQSLVHTATVEWMELQGGNSFQP